MYVYVNVCMYMCVCVCMIHIYSEKEDAQKVDRHIHTCTHTRTHTHVYKATREAPHLVVTHVQQMIQISRPKKVLGTVFPQLVPVLECCFI